MACDARARAGEHVLFISSTAAHRRAVWKVWQSVSIGRHNKRGYKTCYTSGGYVQFRDASRGSLRGER